MIAYLHKKACIPLTIIEQNAMKKEGPERPWNTAENHILLGLSGETVAKTHQQGNQSN